MSESAAGKSRTNVDAAMRAASRNGAPRVRITRRMHFSAAHRLNREDWPAAQNREVFGLCSNPNWHGHNYELDVTVEGAVVIRDLDHRNLNLDVQWLQGVNPTTENLVVAIWNRLADSLPGGTRLARLVLYETPRNIVEYTGETENP
jgi:6-pyruvoyltetrahydropterin/6-carboxytetrahydropterin synthase